MIYFSPVHIHANIHLKETGWCYIHQRHQLWLHCAGRVCLLAQSCSSSLWLPWTVAYQSPLSMEFSRQEYWSGFLFPSPGELPDPGIEYRSPTLDFPGGSDGKASVYNAGDLGFNPWVGKVPWRRKWQSTPVLLLGKSYGQRSLVGYSPRGHKESDTTERLHFHFHLR